MIFDTEIIFLYGKSLAQWYNILPFSGLTAVALSVIKKKQMLTNKIDTDGIAYKLMYDCKALTLTLNETIVLLRSALYRHR